MATKTENRETLKDFRDSYEGGWGDWPEGDEITPDTIASGFFNYPAEIDGDGDVVFGTGHIADAWRLDRFVAHLRERGYI